jgi:hypothetical protein
MLMAMPTLDLDGETHKANGSAVTGKQVVPLVAMMTHLAIGDTWNSINNVEQRKANSQPLDPETPKPGTRSPPRYHCNPPYKSRVP